MGFLRSPFFAAPLVLPLTDSAVGSNEAALQRVTQIPIRPATQGTLSSLEGQGSGPARQGHAGGRAGVQSSPGQVTRESAPLAMLAARGRSRA